MTDKRSERLRQRRKRSKGAVKSHDTSTDEGSSETSKPDEPSKPSESSDNESRDEQTNNQNGTSVKEERTGTYMYLPETQTKELRRLYNILKAKYEVEYDGEFEKNRHFYPLVIQYGLEQLEEMDDSEIRRRVEEIT